MKRSRAREKASSGGAGAPIGQSNSKSPIDSETAISASRKGLPSRPPLAQGAQVEAGMPARQGGSDAYDPGRDRDAWATIRGYVYQVQMTIDRWLHLEPGQALELERGEDIDIISSWAADGNGEGQRLLEQIKHLERSITLNSDAARCALANFVDQRRRNPDVALRFRFVTTARVTREAINHFPNGVCGIDAWETIRSRGAAKESCLRTIAHIRRALLRANKPSGLPAKAWVSFQQYLDSAKVHEWASLIIDFEWATGQEGSEQLRAAIEATILQQRLGLTKADAAERYVSLFAHVFHRLTARGIKRLTTSERDALLSGIPITESDRRLMHTLDAALERLEHLERQVRTHGLAIRRLQETQWELQTGQDEVAKQMTAAQGILGTLSAREGAPDLALPRGAKARAARSDTVRGVVRALAGITWLAIHGTSGSGKTELALLVAQSHGPHGHWLTLRDTSAGEAAERLMAALRSLAPSVPAGNMDTAYQALCERIGAEHLLVLDDVPSFEADSVLGRQIAHIALAFERTGLKLVTTSALPVPQRIELQLGPSVIRSLLAPKMTDEETAELLRAHEAPSDWNILGKASIINLITEGHAELVVTAAMYLKTRGWRFSKEELQELVSGRYAPRVETETLRRVQATTKEESTRELLSRAVLFKGSFTMADIREIAAVPPEVSNPYGHVAQLEGLWLQRDQNERWQVCPSLKSFGSELPTDRQRSVHDAMGLLLVRRPSISPIELHRAIDHFVAAGQYDRAGAGLLLALREFSVSGIPPYDTGLVNCWIATPLPVAMNLGMRIVIRIFQVAIRKKEEHSVDWLLGDIAALFERIDDANVHAVFSLLPHVRLLSEHDFKQCSRYLRRAIDVQFSSILPSGRPLQLFDGSVVEDFVWHQSACIKSEADLREWTRTVQSMSDEQFKRLARDQERCEIFCLSLGDQLRLAEAVQPGQFGGWSNLDSLLVGLADLGHSRGLDLLWASAQRERIILRGEHLGNLDSAIQLAAHLLAHSATEARTRVLLLEPVGRLCLHSGRLADASEYLIRAADTPTEAFPLLRLYVYLEASQVAPEIDGDRYTRAAIAIAKRTPWIPRNVLVQALGERILHVWSNQGTAGIASTLLDMDEALDALLACDPRAPEFEPTARVFGFVVGFLLQKASGVAVPLGPNDRVVSPPKRGLFLNADGKLAPDEERVPPAYIPPVMVQLAETLENDHFTIKWAEQGVTMAKAHGLRDVESILDRRLSAERITRDEYEIAMQLFVDSTGFIVANAQSRGKMPSSSSQVTTAPEVRSGELWRIVELATLEHVVVPAMFRIGTIWLDNPSVGVELAERLDHACRDMEQGRGHPELWRTTRALIAETFGGGGTPRTRGRLQSDPQVEPVIRLIGRIGVSFDDAQPLEEVVGDHIVMLSTIEKSNCSGFSYRNLVTPFVVGYWMRMSQKRAFSFVSPALARQELSSAASEPPSRRAKAILRAAIAGLGIRGVPPEINAWLRGERFRTERD